MNYYPFNVGDYAAHTAHLDMLEDLAYRRMLDLYYRTEQALPSDWRQIARLIRMKEQGAEIEAVLSEFFTLTDDGWSHKRCASEIERMQDKQAKAKASAAASVKSRSTNAQRTLNERSTDVELPTPTPTPTPVNTVGSAKRRTRIPPDFFPDETGVEAIERTGLSLAIERIKFIDYHTGKGSVMADWQAAWRTWVGNAKSFRPAQTRQSAQAKTINELTGGLASVKEHQNALAIA